VGYTPHEGRVAVVALCAGKIIKNSLRVFERGENEKTDFSKKGLAFKELYVN